MISAQLAAGDHLHELSGLPFARGLLALGLAFAAAREDGRFDRWVALFIGWFALIGVIGIGGQLWQRYVPDGAGMTINIDAVLFSVTVGSEVLLLIAALSLFGARRAQQARR